MGEITPEGYFAVMRFHRGYTNIIGKDFAVVCGACNEAQYIRKEETNGTPNITYQRLEWVYSGTFNPAPGTLGI